MNYINVTPDQLKDIAQQMIDKKGHTPCVCKITKMKTVAPTSRRKTHKFTVEVEVTEEVFARHPWMDDFGGFVVLGFNPKILTDEFRGNKK